jgi:hypothetical protein
MKYECFQLTAEDVQVQMNFAMKLTTAQVVSNGHMTQEEREDFLSKYTIIAIRKSAVLSQISKWLFKKEDDGNKYKFAIVEIRK